MKKIRMNLQLFADDDPPATKYRVIENCTVNINGAETKLVRNLVARKTPAGAIVAYDVVDGGAEIELDEGIIARLIADGVIEAIEEETEEESGS